GRPVEPAGFNSGRRRTGKNPGSHERRRLGGANMGIDIERSNGAMRRVVPGRPAGTHFRFDSTPTGHEQKEITVQHILQTLRRRAWTLLACVFLATATAIGVSLLQPKRYEGIARL